MYNYLKQIQEQHMQYPYSYSQTAIFDEIIYVFPNTSLKLKF